MILSSQGIALQDNLRLEEEAPVKYIKTKLKVKSSDGFNTVYGIGCYYGSSQDEDAFEKEIKVSLVYRLKQEIHEKK